MRVVTPLQMSEIDRISIEQYGIPGIVLMENAALAVVDKVLTIFKGDIQDKNIVIVAGKGNNGGDGFAVARHLFNMDINVEVFVVDNIETIRGDAKTNLNILDKIGVPVNVVGETKSIERLESSLHDADLVIDALFGTGFKGCVAGVADIMIDAVTQCAVPVLAVDIPSGVNGDTGKIEGNHIKAEWTVTLGYPKVGLLIYQGCEACGELTVADIGFARNAIDRVGVFISTIDKSYVAKQFPKRVNQSNKGTYGKVLIISGSPGMTGSGILTTMSALRCGAGLAYLAVPRTLANVYAGKTIEPIIMPLEDEDTGFLTDKSCSAINKIMEGKNVVAVGPGLSSNYNIFCVVKSIIESSGVPVVLDADALNVLQNKAALLRQLKKGGVITPHPGEMSRLTGLSIEEVQDNRIQIASKFAKDYNVVTVLKGFRTIVALPNGQVFINLMGNPGMATAGTGDALTGIIAGLIAQGMSIEDGAIAGVFLHGMAGDIASHKIGLHGMLASDLVEHIPAAVVEIG